MQRSKCFIINVRRRGGGILSVSQSATCVHRRHHTKIQRPQGRYTGPLRKKTQRTPYFRYKLAKHITSLALPDVQLQPSTQDRSSDTGYPEYDLSSFFPLFPQEKSRDNISNYVTTASFLNLPN